MNKKIPQDSMTFNKFYSKNLFDKIKKELKYKDGNVIAVLFHPAILSYNGFHTLDGYISIYPWEYKRNFREMIAPALEANPERKAYFDDWGGRAYVFLDADAEKNFGIFKKNLPPVNLAIDKKSFQKLNGKYIFSIAPILNYANYNLRYYGKWGEKEDPYEIYVYGY